MYTASTIRGDEGGVRGHASNVASTNSRTLAVAEQKMSIARTLSHRNSQVATNLDDKQKAVPMAPPTVTTTGHTVDSGATSDRSSIRQFWHLLHSLRQGRL